jgi:peptidyl-prolyl cis-trans isomerase D
MRRERVKALGIPLRPVDLRLRPQGGCHWRLTGQQPGNIRPMLDQMRRGVGNWLAKGMLGLLIVAFAVWGVGDYVGKIGRPAPARIGGTEITADQIRQAYQDEINALSRRLGRRLTPEQARLFGVEQSALARLVNAAAVDKHAGELNLSLSDAKIADLIKAEPSFKGADGQFSPVLFQSFLRQNGINEARFLRDRRREEIREQITDSLLSGVVPPQSVLEQLHQYREETRDIDYLAPDFDKLIKSEPLDETKLREFYEQNKRQFVTPELRKINVLLLSHDAVKRRIDIIDEEIKATYEKTKDRIDTPEKRRIQQLSFPDKAAAEKAYAELSKAKNFTEAATKLGFKEADFDLGLLARREMIDPKIAEAAFSLKKDELSKPVEGQFATVLVRVSEIVPGKQRSYDEVKGEIRDKLAEERTNHEIQTLHDKVEDERASGKPLKEIAEQLKLEFREIPDIDRSGKTADGKPAIEGAAAQAIAQAAFAGSPGLDAEATELADGGYAWVDVVSITPEKQKTFEEAKAAVTTAATDEQRRAEIASFAGKLVDRLGKGESMEAVAKETGTKVQKATGVTRNTVPQGLTQGAVTQAFALPKGGAASAMTADGKSRIILRVTDIKPAPPATPEQLARLKAEVTRQMQGDIVGEYLAALQKRYGLSVNEAAVRQALGSGSQQDIE